MSQRTPERMMDSYVEHFHRRVHGSHTASTAQLPFNHGARRRSGAASCVPLSLVLQRHPSSAAPERINAASRCVTEVDSVPARLCGAAVVYLSGNALTSSSGVEQFACVHTLSLAHNLLSRWEDVRRLAGLPTLAHLRLEGNPLCASPLYRVRTVACLSRGGGALQTLDGAPITQDERLAAERVADWYDAVLGALVQAEGRIHRVALVVKLAAVHLQLRGMFLSGAHPAKGRGGGRGSPTAGPLRGGRRRVGDASTIPLPPTARGAPPSLSPVSLQRLCEYAARGVEAGGGGASPPRPRVGDPFELLHAPSLEEGGGEAPHRTADAELVQASFTRLVESKLSAHLPGRAAGRGGGGEGEPDPSPSLPTSLAGGGEEGHGEAATAVLHLSRAQPLRGLLAAASTSAVGRDGGGALQSGTGLPAPLAAEAADWAHACSALAGTQAAVLQELHGLVVIAEHRAGEQGRRMTARDPLRRLEGEAEGAQGREVQRQEQHARVQADLLDSVQRSKSAPSAKRPPTGRVSVQVQATSSHERGRGVEGGAWVWSGGAGSRATHATSSSDGSTGTLRASQLSASGGGASHAGRAAGTPSSLSSPYDTFWRGGASEWTLPKSGGDWMLAPPARRRSSGLGDTVASTRPSPPRPPMRGGDPSPPPARLVPGSTHPARTLHAHPTHHAPGLRRTYDRTVHLRGGVGGGDESDGVSRRKGSTASSVSAGSGGEGWGRRATSAPPRQLRSISPRPAPLPLSAVRSLTSPMVRHVIARSNRVIADMRVARLKYAEPAVAGGGQGEGESSSSGVTLDDGKGAVRERQAAERAPLSTDDMVEAAVLRLHASVQAIQSPLPTMEWAGAVHAGRPRTEKEGSAGRQSTSPPRRRVEPPAVFDVAVSRVLQRIVGGTLGSSALPLPPHAVSFQESGLPPPPPHAPPRSPRRGVGSGPGARAAAGAVKSEQPSTEWSASSVDLLRAPLSTVHGGRLNTPPRAAAARESTRSTWTPVLPTSPAATGRRGVGVGPQLESNMLSLASEASAAGQDASLEAQLSAMPQAALVRLVIALTGKLREFATANEGNARVAAESTLALTTQLQAAEAARRASEDAHRAVVSSQHHAESSVQALSHTVQQLQARVVKAEQGQARGWEEVARLKTSLFSPPTTETGGQPPPTTVELSARGSPELAQRTVFTVEGVGALAPGAAARDIRPPSDSAQRRDASWLQQGAVGSADESDEFASISEDVAEDALRQTEVLASFSCRMRKLRHSFSTWRTALSVERVGDSLHARCRGGVASKVLRAWYAAAAEKFQREAGREEEEEAAGVAQVVPPPSSSPPSAPARVHPQVRRESVSGLVSAPLQSVAAPPQPHPRSRSNSMHVLEGPGLSEAASRAVPALLSRTLGGAFQLHAPVDASLALDTSVLTSFVSNTGSHASGGTVGAGGRMDVLAVSADDSGVGAEREPDTVGTHEQGRGDDVNTSAASLPDVSFDDAHGGGRSAAVSQKLPPPTAAALIRSSLGAESALDGVPRVPLALHGPAPLSSDDNVVTEAWKASLRASLLSVVGASITPLLPPPTVPLGLPVPPPHVPFPQQGVRSRRASGAGVSPVPSVGGSGGWAGAGAGAMHGSSIGRVTGAQHRGRARSTSSTASRGRSTSGGGVRREAVSFQAAVAEGRGQGGRTVGTVSFPPRQVMGEARAATVDIPLVDSVAVAVEPHVSAGGLTQPRRIGHARVPPRHPTAQTQPQPLKTPFR